MEETKIFTKKDIVALIASLERDLAALSGSDFKIPARRKEVFAIIQKYCGAADALRFKKEIEIVDYDLAHGPRNYIPGGDVRRIAGYVNKAKARIVEQIEGNEAFLKSLK